MRIKFLLIKIFLTVLRVIYAPMKLQKVKNKVTIISRQSNEPSVDIALLSDYIEKNYPQLICRVMCRKLEGTNPVTYAFNMLAQMMNMASSRLVLLDGYCIAACVLDHRKETEIIQMWHALAAIKQFGYQTVGKPSGRSREMAEAMCMHRNYDVVLAPSEVTGDHFCQAFGTDRSRLVYLGLPRIDHILHPDEEKARAIRTRYGISAGGRELVLYVPTFRRGSQVQADQLIAALDPDKYILVIKLHPLDTTEVEAVDRAECEEGERGLRVIVDRDYSSYQWLAAADRVITDYSALGVEAALTGKPLYYYVYDIDSYREDVGLNLDPLKDLPRVSAKSAEELNGIMAEEYDFDRLKKFRDKYISVNTDNCTGRLADFILAEIYRDNKIPADEMER